MRTLNEWHRSVAEARERIAPYIYPTPVVQSEALTARLGQPVYYKCEQFQPMGAFKIRGAGNALLAMAEKGDLKGAVTYSTGNCGLAVAYLGQKLNIPAVICISQRVPQNKVDALKARGARVVIEGDSQDEAQVAAERLAEETGYVLVNPCDDPDVIAGQGTIASEILEQVPNLDTVIVPVSGGGLAAGAEFAAAAC